MIRKGLKSFSLIGWKKTGKTSLLISLLASFPRSCTVCKVYSHPLSSDPSADSSRFADAGADNVFMIPKESLMGKAFIDLPLLEHVCKTPIKTEYLLCEGLLLIGSLTAVIYTQGTYQQGVKPDHGRAKLILHDGTAAAAAWVNTVREKDQLVLNRSEIQTILSHISGEEYEV